jgi:hypothetical protein
VGIFGFVVVCLLLYAGLIARPLVTPLLPSISTQRAAGLRSSLAGSVVNLERVLDALARIIAATQKAASRLAELYVDELADEQELIGNMLRILIGFAQVIGNLSCISIVWPQEFRAVAGWFDFAKISFDVPSLACAIEQSSISYTFYTRHLLYTVAPLVLIVLIALPALWARLRRLPAATIADLDDRRMRWTLFAVFMLYPKARPSSRGITFRFRCGCALKQRAG